jgi:two-component system, cell cycle sensor histidine kinase and response regulator CckA
MFYLPASEKAPIGDGDSIRDNAKMGSETILLIDDENMILDIGSKMLEGLNYKVITAIGGKRGLEIYEKERGQIDLVILDMIMPDISGKETFNALLRINPSVRVLLSSGYSLDDQAREIMQSGCKGFIQKPFTMVDLSKRIRGVLDE